jgi:putative membrane protein
MSPEADLSATTRMAVDRTRLAHERTLMAWVRTATSLISFGFSLYKFGQYLQQDKNLPPEGVLFGARGFATMMIVIGLIALGLATVEHRRDVRALRREYGTLVPYSLSTLIAGFVALLGTLGLAAVVFKQ